MIPTSTSLTKMETPEKVAVIDTSTTVRSQNPLSADRTNGGNITSDDKLKPASIISSMFSTERKSSLSKGKKAIKRRITFTDNKVNPKSTRNRLSGSGKESITTRSESTIRSSSLKSLGPMGWNAASRMMKRRNAVVAGSPNLIYNTVDETRIRDFHGPGDSSNYPNLYKEIKKLRNKRKVKIRTYWNKVLKAVHDVEVERRMHKSQLINNYRQGRKSSGTHLAVKGENQGDANDERENPWAAENIANTTFTQWLLRARSTLPSAGGEYQDTIMLEGKFYRQFKAAGDLVYAKCALTDDDDEREGEFVEHMSEAADIRNTKYRKNFNYFDHLNKIKSFPTTLNKKRLMYRYLNQEAKLFQETEKQCKVRAYPRLYCLYLTVAGVFNDIVPTFQLWKIQIHNLFAYFGSEVFISFLWLRQIILIQVLYMILSMAMMVIPSAYEIGSFNSHIRNSTTNMRELQMVDFLDGSGWLETSLWYYGGHPASKSISDVIPLGSILESSAYRVLLLMIILGFIYFLFMIAWIGTAHSRYASMGQEAKQTLSYFNAVFCSWEFSVNSVQLSGSVHDSIANNFSHLSKHWFPGDDADADTYGARLRKELRDFLSQTKRGVGLKLFGVFVNLITLFVAAASSVVLLSILDLMTVSNNNFIMNAALFAFMNKLGLDSSKAFFLPGLYFSVLFNFVSPVIVFLSDVEVWTKNRIRNCCVIGRLSFIYSANCFVIVVYFTKLSSMWQGMTGKCIETTVGITIYQIIVWEFLFTLGYWMIKDVLLNVLLWKFAVVYTAPLPSMDIFLTSLIFRHTLVTVFVQFAPIAVFASLITLIITYCVKKTILCWIFSHPKVFAHVSDYELPYLLCYYIFGAVFLSCSTILVTKAHPSRNCGPFSLYDNTSSIEHYNSLTNEFEKHYFTRYVIYNVLLQSSGIEASVVALICGAVFIMRKWSLAYKQTLDATRSQLELARKDRVFLLRAIYNYSKHGETPVNGTDGESEIHSSDEDIVQTLDKKNIIRTKMRAVGALISGGKRQSLAKQYLRTKALREKLTKEFEANRPLNETVEQKLERHLLFKEELASDILTPTKEAVEARRQSMAIRFMMNAEAIKFSHKQERLQRHRSQTSVGSGKILKIGKAKR